MADAWQGFEEWWAQHKEELDVRFGAKFISASTWIAAQHALNSEIGIAANESAKAERRRTGHEAVRMLLAANCTGCDDHDSPFHDCHKCLDMQEALDDIIKAAQG